MFLWPYEKKLKFLEFSGSSTQIEGGQNMVSIVINDLMHEMQT